MDELTRKQSELIRTLFEAADARGFPLWLENGWAIDARLGRVTRSHGDIDIAYPAEREAEYVALLAELGFRDREDADYGFLIRREDLLIDTEACRWSDGEYGFPGFPEGSCPLNPEGSIQGTRVRCVSWEALYYELLEYIDEIPEAEWRGQDFVSRGIIEANLQLKSAMRSVAVESVDPHPKATKHHR
jgi:2''-aminoglycoside nucleotidyltransferase